MIVLAVLIESEGKGVVVLKISYESGELGHLHAVAAGILPILNGSECIQNMIKLGCELTSFFIKASVLVDFGNGGRVVKVLNFFN